MPLTKTPVTYAAAVSLLLSIFLLTTPIGELRAAPKPPKSPIGKYLDGLLKMQTKSATKNDVSMRVSVIHDAYLYFMAKTYQEYEDLGLDENLLSKKLGSAHTKYKRFQKRLLFRISISGTGGKHVIFDKSLASHLEVNQKSEKNAFSKRTFHEVDVSPRVKAEQWKLFGKRISDYTRKSLFVFKNLRAEVTSFSVKSNTTEPVYFKLNEIWTAKSIQKSAGKKTLRSPGKGKKGRKGKGISRKQLGGLGNVTPHEPVINPGENQISAKMSFTELKKPGPTVILTPGHWDAPLPPRHFLGVLKKLADK